MFYSIRFQLHLHASRSLSILVVRIIPRLCNRYTRLSRRVAVCDVVTFYRRRIISNFILCYCVLDLLSILIFRQVLELILPPIRFCNSLAFFHLSICKKVYRDRCRSLSVLIVCIVPRLCSADLGRLRRVAVCYREIPRLSCHLSLVTRNLGYLFHCVSDILTVLLQIKVCPGVCPLPFAAQRYRVSMFYSIRFQLHLHTLRSLSILIIRIVPRLRDRDACCLRCRCIPNSQLVAIVINIAIIIRLIRC